MASFGHLSVRVWIRPFSKPETPSHGYGRFASKRLHLDTFLSRFGLSHFRVHIHIHKTISDFVPDGIIRTPCCPDLDQAIFEPRYTFPKPLQICFQMASCGRLSVQIRIRPFSSPKTHPQKHRRFCSGWLHLDTLLSRSGSSHFRTQIHLPKAIADLLPDGFIWTPFCPDMDQATWNPR